MVLSRELDLKRYRLLPLAALLAACSSQAAGDAQEPVCRVLQSPAPLPEQLPESSGAAVSRRHPELVWSHNDSGGEAALFAVHPTGRLLGVVEVEGADNDDWEDLATGPCPAGDCLFIGDIGDNEAKRDRLSIYRVPEPDPSAGRTEEAERFRIRYPGGARDAEGLFVLPSGELFVVTKGRNSGVEVYRYPLPFRSDEVVELERVATLSSGERPLPNQITAAAATPAGEWIVLRDYVSLSVFRAADLVGGGDLRATHVFDLQSLDEPQGEAVAALDNGRVVLTTEGPGQNTPGLISVLHCPAIADR